MKHIFLIFGILLIGISISAQEICNDAIDNDNDGLIDLNDPDCECVTSLPASLIPNPSFEEMSCCPTTEGELNCADGWIQASTPTTDYVHTCGVLGNPFLFYEAPLPLPDGQGAIGFRDGKPGTENFKEYAGACLLEPLIEGECYRLDFFVGFHDVPGSDRFPMAIFGAPSCNSLPFGNGDPNFGCPTNGPGWFQIGELVVEGNNEWVNVVFEFTPDRDYEAIVLGPGCEIHPSVNLDPYFYFDDLTIATKRAFGILATDISGDICDNDLVLRLEDDLSSDYQWYYNGIALIGETSPALGLAGQLPEGVYSATINTPDGCFLSEQFYLEYPQTEYFETLAKCRGETYEFGSQAITETGTYQETFIKGVNCDSTVTLEITFEPLESFETVEICDGDIYELGDQSVTDSGIVDYTFVLDSGCDSIAVVDLRVNPLSETFRVDTICLGETFILEEIETQEEGDYVLNTFNEFGCDSTVNISLRVLDGLGYLELVDTIDIDLGEIIDISPDDYSADARDFLWRDNSDNVLSDVELLSEAEPFVDSWYFLDVTNVNNCTEEDSVFVRVRRNIKVFTPNVFTPQKGGPDETFVIGFDSSVRGFEDFNIYDRWGELVYQYKGSVYEYQGWDGLFNGKEAEIGVYTYYINALISDGSTEKYTGNLLLLR